MAKIERPTGKAKGTKGKPLADTTTNLDAEELAPMNFKVSLSFKREFKIYASEHDMSMRNLLEKAFQSYKNPE